MDKMNKDISTEKRKRALVLRKGLSAPVVEHVLSLLLNSAISLIPW